MSKKANAITVQFPLVVKKGGKEVTIWVDAKEYAAKRAEQFSKSLKVNFTSQQVASLLKAAKSDTPLDDSASDEAQQAYESVQADLTESNEKVEELRSIQDQEEANESAVRAAQAKKETALVAKGTANINPAEGLKRLTEVFDLGKNFTQCTPKDDNVSDEDIIGALAFSFGLSDLSAWAVGDLINILEDRGLENVVTQVCEKINRNYQTASKYARTARAFAPGSRDNRLSFSHYAEIGTAVLADTDKKAEKSKLALVASAMKEGMNTAQLRDAVKTTQIANGVRESEPEAGSPEAIAIAGEATPRYLVLDITSDDIEETAYTTDDIDFIDNDTKIVVDLLSPAFGMQSGKAFKWTAIAFKPFDGVASDDAEEADEEPIAAEADESEEGES